MSTIWAIRIGATLSNIERLILLVIIVAGEVLVGVNVAVETEDWLILIFDALVEEVVEHLAAEAVVGPVVLFLWIFFDAHHICFFLRRVEVVDFVKPHWELTYILWSSELLLSAEDVVFILVDAEIARP